LNTSDAYNPQLLPRLYAIMTIENPILASTAQIARHLRANYSGFGSHPYYDVLAAVHGFINCVFILGDVESTSYPMYRECEKMIEYTRELPELAGTQHTRIEMIQISKMLIRNTITFILAFE